MSGFLGLLEFGAAAHVCRYLKQMEMLEKNTVKLFLDHLKFNHVGCLNFVLKIFSVKLPKCGFNIDS